MRHARPSKTILRVEDKPDDALLTRRALRASTGSTPGMLARDGAESVRAPGRSWLVLDRSPPEAS